ncbi:MAG: MOSC domain-containing protein [Blastocatellia bacterium]
MGRLTSIHIGARKGDAKTAVNSAELVADYGLRGDSHAGHDPRRQVSLFAAETLAQLHAEGFSVAPEQLAANLFTEQIDLDALSPGARLRVGETTLEIVERRSPCRSITRIDNRLPKRLYGRCGQLARILVGGAVHPGDEVHVIPDERQLTLGFEEK